MSNYTKTVDFASKDTLPSGDSGKIIKGTEFETEFDNIATAVATKADSAAPTFTGTSVFADLDISGDIDVDGTTNLDAVDIDGAVDMATTLAVAGNVDFNGDLDVDGTTNLDAVDIDGAVQADGTVTVGVDDTGYDVKFFGATSGKSLLWDESADSLIVTGNSTISGTLGVTGVLTGTSLDISGDIDVDGTTNLDATNIVGALDVTGSVTADGLTLDSGTATPIVSLSRSGTHSGITFSQTVSNTTGAGADLINYSSNNDTGYVWQTTDSGGTQAKALLIAPNRDISFYEDTGTTAKLHWDAADERLGIGTASPNTTLDITTKSNTNGFLLNVIGTAPNYMFDVRDDGASKFRIDSSGAATFNSTIATGSGGGSGKIAITGGTATNEQTHVTFTNTAGAKTFAVGGGQSGVTNNGFVIRNVTDNTFPLVISDAGAATFSSSLTVNGVLTKIGGGTSSQTVGLVIDHGSSAAYSLIQAENDNGTWFSVAGDGKATFGGKIEVAGDIVTKTAGTSNFRAGVNAGNSIVSGGNYNVLVGDEAGTAITTGDNNVAVGYQAGAAISTGDNNVALGLEALTANMIGDRSTAIGNYALKSQNPSSNADMYNVAVGHNAGGDVSTGTNNTFVGGFAGDGTDDATNCVAVGKSALSANCGDSNTAVGAGALAVTTATNNTAVGKDAGILITSGSKNTIIGHYDGNQGGLDIRTSDNNIVLSDGDGNPRGIFDSSGNFLVGATALDSQGVRIFGDGANGFYAKCTGTVNYWITRTGQGAGTGNIATIYSDTASVGSISVTASATAYNTSSDHRLKENVVYDWDATARLKQLKPARFNFIADADTTVDGFLAHEAQAVVPESVTGTHNEVDDDGVAVMQGIDQSKLVPLLVKAIQEQQALIESLTARITTLEG